MDLKQEPGVILGNMREGRSKGVSRKEASEPIWGAFFRLDSHFYIPILTQQVQVYVEEVSHVILIFLI